LGDVSIVTDLAAIKQSLINIFNTPRGSRLFLPEFGCDVRRFLFEPYDEVTAKSIGTEIKNSFELYEPRVKILKVEVKMNSSKGTNGYEVDITYEIRRNRKKDRLQVSLEKL
jgi:phage baseplate assembly protein W